MSDIALYVITLCYKTGLVLFLIVLIRSCREFNGRMWLLLSLVLALVSLLASALAWSCHFFGGYDLEFIGYELTSLMKVLSIVCISVYIFILWADFKTSLKTEKLFWSFSGRTPRSILWFFTITVGTASLQMYQIFSDFPSSHPLIVIGYGFLPAVWGLLCGFSMFSICVRRWHDLGKSGWMAILLFIPLVNHIVFLYLCIAKGNESENEYGVPIEYKT